jgi:type II secretory pathway component PulM
MLKDKFYALSAREQKILIIAAPVVALLIVWLVIIKPIIDTDTRLTKSNTLKQQHLTWMLSNAHQVKSNTTTAANQHAPPVNKSQLRQIMGQLLKSQKISIQRIQNINQQNVSYQLDDSDFNSILRLIAKCADRQIKVVQLQIAKSSLIGKVNTRITVAAQT